MKVFLPSLALIAAVGLATVSCRNDYEGLPQRIAPKELTLKDIDQQRTEFAGILARSMNDMEVRALIKRESAKQFDKDYDILFSLVKDMEIRDGVTFEQYLAKYATSPKRFSELIENLPLLTIYVPELAKFSVNSWEVSTQIPLVAVMNSDHDEKKHTVLKAFDYNGNQSELASNEEPTIPVIVVKENERVIVVNNNKNGRFNPDSNKGRLVYRGKTSSFYFMDDAFDKEKEETIKRAGRIANYNSISKIPLTPVDPRVQEAWNKKAPVHRDYVYYNILTPTGEGTLDYNYAEHITNIQFVNSAAISNANDDQTSDWADGGLEISVDILFFDGTGTLKNTNKMLAVPVSSIKDIDGNPKPFYLPNPVGIGPWDMNTQGNTWQFILQEWDPIGEYTETVTHSSKFSANFKISGTVIKIGLEGGGTYETTHTKQTTRKVSTTSDQLGKAELYFKQPVITQETRNANFYNMLMYYNVLDLNTGSVLLTVEPRKLL